MHPFRAFILEYTEITDSDWKLVEPSLSHKVYQENRFILKEGKVCNHLYFLENGLVRYFISSEGKEKTILFKQPPSCFTSQSSFTQQLPATENIQAIEESAVWMITREDSDRLIDLVPNWNIFLRKLDFHTQHQTHEILKLLECKTPEERYDAMLKFGPDLVDVIPLKHLASYLDMTPQMLTIIHKRHAAKKSRPSYRR